MKQLKGLFAGLAIAIGFTAFAATVYNYFPPPGITYTPTGGTVFGTATGGAQGAGTVNAQGLFVNGTAVSTFASSGSANQVLATPAASSGTVALRSLVSADIPAINLAASGNGGVTGITGVTNGGNGIATATLGDLRYGSGTNTLAALAGNTTTTKKFLTQTGTGTVSAAPIWNPIATADLPIAAANPTASVGLTVVNGSSTNYMRSDAAPALSQAISPTWTGNHTFQQSGTAQDIVVSHNVVSSYPMLVTNAFGGTASQPILALTSTASGGTSELEMVGNNGTLGTNGVGILSSDGTNGVRFINRDNTSLSLWTNTIQRFTVNAGGGVIIGGPSVTSTPTLSVGGGNASNSIQFSGTPTTAATSMLGFVTGSNGLTSVFGRGGAAGPGMQANFDNSTTTNYWSLGLYNSSGTYSEYMRPMDQTTGKTLINDLESSEGVTASTASGTFVTIFTANGTHEYLVFCTLPTSGDANNYNATYLVSVNNSAAARADAIRAGGLMTLQVSGTQVQCEQGSGAANTITWHQITLF